jgi:VanZ family protein
MIKKYLLSIITALVILFLSFARAETFSNVNILGLPYLDKAVHLCMYFALMMVLVYENRSSIKNIRSFFVLSIIPLVFGIMIEFLQTWLTSTRTGDFFDALFNLLGIFIALPVWLLFQNFIQKKR